MEPQVAAFDRSSYCFMTMLMSFLLFGQAGCSDAPTEEPINEIQSAITLKPPVVPPGSVYSFVFPQQIDHRSVSVAGMLSVYVDDRAHVGGSVTSTGQINVGVDAHVSGSVLSPGRSHRAIVLRSRAVVTGSVRGGAHIITSDGVAVGGGLLSDESIGIGSLDILSVPVTVPTSPCAAAQLAPNADTSLAPGVYCDLIVNSNAKARLRSGTYYVKSLDLEPQSQLILDKSSGPIVVYVVSGRTIVRGAVISQNGRRSDFLLASLSSQDIFITGSMIGTVFAPYGSITADVYPTQIGAFYGKNVTIHQGINVVFDPFDFSTVAVEKTSSALSGPFRTMQEAVNTGLSQASIIYQNTGEEGAVITFRGPDGLYYDTTPVEGTHVTTTAGTLYTVMPNTSEVPSGGKVVSQEHSHPEGGEPGRDDFNNPVPTYFIDADGNRFLVSPGSGAPKNIGKMSEDPEDGILPLSDGSISESDQSDEGEAITGVAVQFVSSLTDIDLVSPGESSNGFFDDIFNSLFGL